MMRRVIGHLVCYVILVLLGTSLALVEQFKITHSNKCSSTETYFRILYEKSLKECAFECDIRPTCAAINYRHRRQQCELLEVDNPTTFVPTTEQTGPCVYIKKNHIYMNSSDCCGNSCDRGQVCNTNTGQCIIKECPRFLLRNGRIWGNMYKVGSRLKTQCESGFTERDNDIYTTCKTSGLWVPDILCTPDITPKSFHTSSVFNYLYIHSNGVDVTDKESVTFSVRSCNDAHIALSSTLGDSNSETYELVIGGWGNTRSAIRDCKQCSNLAKHSAVLLSCNEARPFWISWSGGLIAIGTGNDVGNSQLMSWNDPTPHEVNYIAISSGYGADGDWIF